MIMIDHQPRYGVRASVILLLLMSAMTFAVPREVFDPHVGVDLDIFCRLYVTFLSENPESYDIEMIFQTDMPTDMAIPSDEPAPVNYSRFGPRLRGPPNPLASFLC